jgi:hypothetical protein
MPITKTRVATALLDPAKSSPGEASPETPNEGAIVILVDSHGLNESVELTKALHWTENGRHYISSTEFQVSSSGGTFTEAYVHMLDNLMAEARTLLEVIEAEDAAPNEREEALALMSRMQKIVEVEARLERKREQQAEMKRLLRYRRFARRFSRHASITKSRQWQIAPSARHHSASALSG